MISRLVSIAGAVVLLTSCSDPSAMPTTESRESGPWKQNATVIKTARHTIYYYGTAHPDSTPGQSQWSGVVEGDIYVRSSDGNTILIPAGKLMVSSTDTLLSQGRSRSGFSDKSGD